MEKRHSSKVAFWNWAGKGSINLCADLLWHHHEGDCRVGGSCLRHRERRAAPRQQVVGDKAEETFKARNRDYLNETLKIEETVAEEAITAEKADQESPIDDVAFVKETDKTSNEDYDVINEDTLLMTPGHYNDLFFKIGQYKVIILLRRSAFVQNHHMSDNKFYFWVIISSFFLHQLFVGGTKSIFIFFQKKCQIPFTLRYM